MAACKRSIGLRCFRMQTVKLRGPGGTAAAGLSPRSAPNKRKAAARDLSGSRGGTLTLPVARTLVMSPPGDARG